MERIFRLQMFKLPNRKLPLVTEENSEYLIKTAGLRAEILTRDQPNTKPEF
jgi:hypothetical protein